MAAEDGLKAQKLLAQGSALGNVGKNKVALKGQKLSISKLLPFQGDFAFYKHYPGRCPGLGASALSGRVDAKHTLLSGRIGCDL